jgi:hypothetical protein
MSDVVDAVFGLLVIAALGLWCRGSERPLCIAFFIIGGVLNYMLWKQPPGKAFSPLNPPHPGLDFILGGIFGVILAKLGVSIDRREALSISIAVLLLLILIPLLFLTHLAG